MYLWTEKGAQYAPRSVRQLGTSGIRELLAELELQQLVQRATAGQPEGSPPMMSQHYMIDLNALIEREASTRLTRVATTGGGEYAGPCPWCGGVDRLRVWPFSERPHYWCRGCEASGDAIQFLKDYKHLSYVEACQELDIAPGDTQQHETPLFFDDQPPCKAWQDMARALMERAERFLWKNKARAALDYLLKRGFTEATIKQAHLGFIPLVDGKWFTSPFSGWGLTDDMLSDKQREKGCVRVPSGILIPWQADGQVWKLAMKRFEAGKDEPKYGQVIGSKDALYCVDSSLTRGKPVLLCEGEFDCLSVSQEAGDLIAPIATGSASKGRIPLWIAKVATTASQVLLCFDLDLAGSEAAAYWKETFGEKAMPWPPQRHDINDMLQAERPTIRQWITTGLSIATVPLRPLARGEARDDEPFFCTLCRCDLYVYEGQAYYSAEGQPYCDNCWVIQAAPPPPASRPTDWLICSQCRQCTSCYHHDDVCGDCWFASQPKAAVSQLPFVTWARPKHA